MADFVPLAVKTVARARDAGAELRNAPDVHILGGGTLLMRAVNEGDGGIRTLVRVTDPELRRLRAGSSRVELGASLTMADVLASDALDFLHPVARSIGGPAVRQMATIGGNLLAPSPYGDFAVALLALGTRVLVQAGYSARELALEELLAARQAPGASASPELVSGVVFNRPRGLRYFKLSRVHPKGAAVVSVAAHLDERGGRVSQVRIAAGAVAPSPLRLTRVERALEGQRLDAATIETAVAQAAQGLEPPTDAIASSRYRRAVLPVTLRRLLMGEV